MEHIKDLLSRIMTHCRLEVAIVKYLEELEQRVYSLEQKQKIDNTAVLRNSKEIGDIKTILRQKVTV